MIRMINTRTFTQNGIFQALKTKICKTFMTKNIRNDAPSVLEIMKNPAPVLYDQKPKRWLRYE
jgi:hypothetical protein